MMHRQLICLLSNVTQLSEHKVVGFGCCKRLQYHGCYRCIISCCRLLLLCMIACGGEDLAGFVQCLRLADWRRRAFFGYNRPLDEFELTFPRTNILTAIPLEMDTSGDIRPMAENDCDAIKAALRSGNAGSSLKCQGNQCVARCPL